jgi:hypothetical protein
VCAWSWETCSSPLSRKDKRKYVFRVSSHPSPLWSSYLHVPLQNALRIPYKQGCILLSSR